MSKSDKEQEVNELIDQIAEAVTKVLEDQAAEQKAIKDNLAKTVEGKLSSRMGTRKAKENQWLESLRLYLGSLSTYNIVTGEYPFGATSDKTLAHRPEVNIVRDKCETAVSQTMAFQFAGGDKNWALQPPSTFELDQDDMAQIQNTMPPNSPPLSQEEVMAMRIDMMEKQMETHLENTNYGAECRKAGIDRVVLGTGVMKCPTNSTQLKKTYIKAPDREGKMQRIPSFSQELTPRVYRVNNWYFFPDDTVTDIDDAEDSIEVHPLSKTQLKQLAQNPAFDRSEIEACLVEEPRQYINSPFNDPAYLTQGVNLLKNRYLVLEYHGPIKRSDLDILGHTPAVDNGDDEFLMEVWVVNSRVIRMEFSNIEGCHRVPYVVCPWEPDPATVFGFGVPMLVRDQQRVINETHKMMLDNAGISAGPQVIVDTTLINPADGTLECTPWKVWYVNEFGADVTKAIQFFMPQNAFEGLSALFSLTLGLADRESSIPNLSMSLNNPTGAADSATGMAIAQANAQSPLFYKSEQWDDQITKPLIRLLYEWEMQYNPRDEIKGEYEIDVKTSTSRLQSSITQQKLEKLMMMATQPNSPLGEWIEFDGLTQSFLLGMHLPYKGIVKTPDKVAQERANRPPPPPDPNLIKAQAETAKVEVDKARIQMEYQKLQLEADQKHQEAIMKYQAQLRTDDVRSREAEASVIKSRYDYLAQMAALAQKDEIDRAKIMADMHSDALHVDTEKFLAGGEMALRAKDQQLKQEELKIKKQTGSGI